jgi:hypothetical protein
MTDICKLTGEELLAREAAMAHDQREKKGAIIEMKS